MSSVHQILNLRTELGSGVPAEATEYARAKVAAVAEYAPADVHFAHVRLSTDGLRLIVAHASSDAPGTRVNAEAAAETYQEAVDLLHDRSQHQLADMRR